jgi:hypothetical protein
LNWRLELINRFGDIIVVIVCIIIWNVHSSRLETTDHTQTFFNNKRNFRSIWKDGELMFSLWIECCHSTQRQSKDEKELSS